MKRSLWLAVVGLVLFFGSVSEVGAQSSRADEIPVASVGASVDENLEVASESAEASGAANLVQRITEKSNDLTETSGEVKGKLGQYVLQEVKGPPTPFTLVRWGIRSAVINGVPANTIVLVLMFPIVTALIAASRHLVGLRGFGIFTPAIVSVGFLATGLTTGFLLFFSIILVATVGRMGIRKLRLPYMPRTSLLLWLVSLTVLFLLILSPSLNLNALAQLSIFPILLMVLLAETFIEVQNKRSRSEAIEMTLETLLLAVVSYFVMNLEGVQKFVLVNPELVVVGVLLFNIFLGKFAGLRVVEYWRFRSLLDR